MKRTARLTIEMERVLVIRSRKAAPRARCSACGEVVNFVTADEAAALMRVSACDIYRRVEAGGLHFTEVADWALLICLNSLKD